MKLHRYFPHELVIPLFLSFGGAKAAAAPPPLPAPAPPKPETATASARSLIRARLPRFSRAQTVLTGTPQAQPSPGNPTRTLLGTPLLPTG